jgi:hypothetical protein
MLNGGNMVQEFGQLVMMIRANVLYGSSPRNSSGMQKETLKIFIQEGKTMVWHEFLISDYNPMPFSDYSGPLSGSSYLCERVNGVDVSNKFNSIEKAIRVICDHFQDSDLEIMDHSSGKWVFLANPEYCYKNREERFSHIASQTMNFKDEKYNISECIILHNSGAIKVILRLRNMFSDGDELFIFYNLDNEMLVKYKHFLRPKDEFSKFQEAACVEDLYSIDIGTPRVSKYPPIDIKKLLFVPPNDQPPKYSSIYTAVKEQIIAMCKVGCQTIEIQLPNDDKWIELVDEMGSPADTKREKEIRELLNKIF